MPWFIKKKKKTPSILMPSFFNHLIKSRLHKLHVNRRHRHRHLINNGFVRKLIIILVLLLLLKLLILQVAVITRKERRDEKVFWTLKNFTELINQISSGQTRAQNVDIAIDIETKGKTEIHHYWNQESYQGDLLSLDLERKHCSIWQGSKIKSAKQDTCLDLVREL